MTNKEKTAGSSDRQHHFAASKQRKAAVRPAAQLYVPPRARNSTTNSTKKTENVSRPEPSDVRHAAQATESVSYGHEDELASVGAIFFNEVSVEPPNRAVLTCDKDLRIAFILPDDYPDRSSPELEISAPSLSAAGKQRIHAALQRVFSEHPREPVLYYAIDAALQMQRDATSFADENDSPKEATSAGEWTEEDQKAVEEEERRRREEKTSVVHVPETYSGESVEDRKSVFQAHVARIKSKEEAMAVLAKLKENSKIARATHNMYAWVTTTEKNGKSFELHDCEDDGENAAGAKLLNLLSLMQIRDVIVVVTRWYGGIHLGPDRFRHIASAARQALVDGGFARNAK